MIQPVNQRDKGMENMAPQLLSMLQTLLFSFVTHFYWAYGEIQLIKISTLYFAK